MLIGLPIIPRFTPLSRKSSRRVSTPGMLGAKQLIAWREGTIIE
jgi:hypothetical protein